MTISSVTVNSPSMQGGTTLGGSVILTGVAPPGGALVALSISSPTLVSVPTTLTVPAGVNSRVFFGSTAQVTTTTSAVITATYHGSTRSVTQTLTPPPPQPTASLDSVVLNPALVQTGTTSTSVTIYFTALTPVGGALVTLSSSNTALATVPASVLVPAFSSSGALTATIEPGVSGDVTISATYNDVTRSAVLTITTQSLLRIITESPLPNARIGENYAGFIEACCGQGAPYTWSLVSGTVPDGLRFAGNDLQLTRTTAVTGVATRVQTTTFTVRVRDEQGNTATKTFTLTVEEANPLIINNGTSVLTSGKVGVAYNNGLFPLGGVPPWSWSHVGGTLPPGLAVQASPGRVLGTPTTAGTFTFTVRVDDSAGHFATGQFTITIAP
ncbi:MAG: putative Ig domain-containing protein [Actinomycetota bacterium]|nr:putative Ig domain-containing protein [Actinomycetota bacterium]